MKEIFDLKRFGNYFGYDLNRAVTRYGLTALIVGLMPLLFFVFGSFFSLIFGGNLSESTALYQSWPIAAFFILVMSFGPRVWGAVTDRKLGAEWIAMPASGMEKTLSLLLITCIVLPAAMLALMGVGNALLSLFVPDLEPWLSFDKIVQINEIDVFGDGPYFNVPLVLWLNWCESILIFTLVALCFKRNKVGKTLLCCIGFAMLIGIIMMLCFHTTNFSADDFERFFGDFDADRAQTWINVGLNLLYGVVFTALIGGIWARIKTIKA